MLLDRGRRGGGQPRAPQVPDAPVLTGTPGNTVAHLSWTIPNDNGSPITDYQIFRNGILIADPVSPGTTWDDFGRVNGVTDAYRVDAANSAGVSQLSNQVLVTAAGDVPEAPVLSTLTPVGNSEIDAAWTQPNDGGSPITNYRIYRGTNIGNLVALATVGAGSTTFADTTVAPATQYVYQVSAINSTGEGPRSNGLAATAGGTVPAAPVLSGSVNASHDVDLTWTIPADGGSPLIDFVVRRDGVVIALFLGPTATSYTDTTPVDGTTYQYTVAAKNNVGEGPNSNLRSFTIPVFTGGGVPTLPANSVVGRPASELVYIGQYNSYASPMSDFTTWKNTLGITGMVIRLPDGSGSLFGFGGSQRLRGSTAMVAPFASDSSYSFMRSYEGTTGPYQARRTGIISKVLQFQKLHKPKAASDLGPFGGDWWDDAHWAAVCAQVGPLADGVQFLGGDGLHYDPEFGHWDIAPTGGHTLAEQYAKVEQRGFEWGVAVYTAFPDAIQSNYGTYFKGSWYDEIVTHNAGVKAGSQTWGVYNGHSSSDVANVTVEGEGRATQRQQAFFRGIWRAAATGGAGGTPLAGPNAKWIYSNHFWYHAQTQYPGVALETAMRWEQWAIYSWLSRQSYSSVAATDKKVRDWVMEHFYISGTSWAGTDSSYYPSQLTEPGFANLLASLRKWMMAGMKTEYMLGSSTGTPSGFQPLGAIGGGPSSAQESAGRPVGGYAWGRNVFTGAAQPGAAGFSGVLGTSPTGGGSPGQTVTYDGTSPGASPAWSKAFVPGSSRPAGMLAAGSTAAISSSLPTITLLSAVTAGGGNLTVTCRVTHPFAPKHVKVYAGSTFNPANPEASLVGAMKETFEPNNGTNLPPAGLTNPYMDCTFTSTGGGWASGDWVVIKCESTKEDKVWAKTQVA